MERPCFVSVPLTLAAYCAALSRKVWTQKKKKIPAMTEDFFRGIFFTMLSLYFLFCLHLLPSGKYCTLSVNKGRMKSNCKKRTDSLCLEGCLIKGKCLFSAVQQQSLSLQNTNIVINFNFLHLFGHQRADRIIEKIKQLGSAEI